MPEPMLGEIRMVAFDFAPRGWALCDGQLLAIDQNPSLYSLLGTTYGGDGKTTFALPDLRGRAPLAVGSGFAEGRRGGEETHALAVGEIPSHTHEPRATNATPGSGDDDPTGKLLATAPGNVYAAPTDLVPMAPAMVAEAGAGQGHENMMPWLALNFVIALHGLFPSGR